MLRQHDQSELVRFMNALAVSECSALLLDYDGTLAPFCVERSSAKPYPGVVTMLQRIIAAGRTRVVIVTGRVAREVVPLLGIHPSPEIWGCHGLQRLLPDGACETGHVDRDALSALAEADRWLRHEHIGPLVEHKPGGIAVHWRGAEEAEAGEVRRRVLRGWAPIAKSAAMSLMEFAEGIEIRIPAPDKGDAVRTVVNEMGDATPVAYLGDDTTDERAFQALGNRGLSILVRKKRRETSARVWLRPPQQLLEFLASWLEAGAANRGISQSEAVSSQGRL